MSNDDYSLALKLQQEFDRELRRTDDILVDDTDDISPPPSKRSKRQATDVGDDLNATQNLVHPEWETIDPTPDIFALFGAFNVKFFNGKLHCVQLEWSKKMYSCAGICYQRRNRMGMSCTIRLSEPLLKLRQRKDLVETLLHEMIHAFLFVLNIREGNGGHGPNFQKIMQSINCTAGTNITVYHTFHDEVNLYKTHVWRCNGICKERQPFFGYVRRTCNRAPGPNDQWWAQHKQTCGGYFKKVSEPEPKKRGRPNATVVASSGQNINHPKWGMKSGNNSKADGEFLVDLTGGRAKKSAVQTVTRPTTVVQSTPVKRSTSKSHVGGNLTNVVGLKDLSDSDSDTPNKRNHRKSLPTTGGHTLGKPNVDKPAITAVRDIWSNRFPSTCNTSNPWETIDDDIQIREPKIETIELDDDDDTPIDIAMAAPTKLSTDERQRQIKKEILDRDDDDSDIELIDDDFDDELADTSIVLGDTSVIDDIFGVDTLMSDFKDINGNGTRAASSASQEIISCPICPSRMCRDQFEEHLNGCLGISVKIDIAPPRHGKKRTEDRTPFASTSRPVLTERQALIAAGYTDEVADRVLRERQQEQRYDERILKEIRDDSKTAECPICQAKVSAATINAHIDRCIFDNSG